MPFSIVTFSWLYSAKPTPIYCYWIYQEWSLALPPRNNQTGEKQENQTLKNKQTKKLIQWNPNIYNDITNPGIMNQILSLQGKFQSDIRKFMKEVITATSISSITTWNGMFSKVMRDAVCLKIFCCSLDTVLISLFQVNICFITYYNIVTLCTFWLVKNQRCFIKVEAIL